MAIKVYSEPALRERGGGEGADLELGEREPGLATTRLTSSTHSHCESLHT